MNDKQRFKLEYAGWLFWLVTAAILLGPITYGAFQLVREREGPFVPIGIGIIVAAFASGVITWAVNAVLQWRLKQRRVATRKKTRKH